LDEIPRNSGDRKRPHAYRDAQRTAKRIAASRQGLLRDDRKEGVTVDGFASFGDRD